MKPPASDPLFPADFVWGAATSAYQIEGAATADGRGPSVWDAFDRQPGAVTDPGGGATACDHYRHFPEDVRLMRQIGLGAYRFSFSWTRLFPDGAGRRNEAGFDFYDRLIDELLASGVTPWATLFHWDYPLALHRRGGWRHPDSPRWFADYAAAAAERFGDRVRHWLTLNEPQCFIWLGHGTGYMAPGERWAFPELLLAAHHVLLAHGRAVQAVRAAAPRPVEVGWAPTGDIPFPVEATTENIAAARAEMFAVRERSLWNHAWWSDPVYLGTYPADGMKLFESDLPPIGSDDMALISQPLDFRGVNLYNGFPVAAGEGTVASRRPRPPGEASTSLQWHISPEAMHWGLRFLHERYGSVIYVTENGMANLDWVDLGGGIEDPQRIDYLRRYLLAVAQARAVGADVRGYFHWTLMDNYEWVHGFRARFGLVHVDFTTQRRTPKASAKWFADVIRSRGAAVQR